MIYSHKIIIIYYIEITTFFCSYWIEINIFSFVWNISIAFLVIIYLRKGISLEIHVRCLIPLTQYHKSAERSTASDYYTFFPFALSFTRTLAFGVRKEQRDTFAVFGLRFSPYVHR